MIRALLGDPGATAEATASVAVARRSGELRVQAQAVRGLARVLDWRGEEDSALAAFEEAERLFRTARDRSWLAVTLMNKGNLFRKRGDLGETIEARTLEGWGYPYYEVSGPSVTVSTLMAPPEGAPQVKTFVKAAPLQIHYNSRLPIVVYAPLGYEVRYRIWSASGTTHTAEKN